MGWAADGGHEVALEGGRGLTLALRSSSLVKVDPQVLHRHPVIGVRAAFALFIREGLKDRPSSPPHCKHKCWDKRPLFYGLRLADRGYRLPPPAKARGVGDPYSLQDLYVLGLQAFWTFGHLELHCLSFSEAPKPARLDSGEVNEHVLSTGTAEKAIAFRVVKPLHGSLFHWVIPCSFCEFPAQKIGLLK
jgi:hypothetical protein